LDDSRCPLDIAVRSGFTLEWNKTN